MKWNKLIGLVFISVLLLAACSNNDNQAVKKTSNINENKASNKNITTDTKIQSLTEAKGIPAAEKKALLAVTNQYVKAFNEKNLDAYMATISKHPTSFKYEEEKAYTKKAFDTMDIKLAPTKISIIGYKTNDANVYMELKTTVVAHGEKAVRKSRQVNTYHKEEGKWKLTSIMAMETK